MPDDQESALRRQEENKKRVEEMVEIMLRGTGRSPAETPLLAKYLEEALQKWQEYEATRKPD